MAEKVEVLVDGGKATPGQPLGPVLGPLGVNVIQVVAAINEKTRAFTGMKVPVKIVVEKDRSFTVEVGTPPTSALILKELGAEKGSGKPRTDKVGDLSIEQARKIARMKQDSLLGRNLRNAVKEVIGACVSMGVTVEGKDPREVQREIDEGKHDGLLKG
ncbi:MAG: 50S ribosomal protein L11 [Euryarchaeota archaeon]|nr:50S ribosomal protein L11 [Euryarchaeota archaeon]